MSRPTYLRQIREKIAKSAPESLFVPSDFYDIADPVQVCSCLKRITDGGGLTRIMHGLYAKPDNAKPESDDIARAIARSFGWTIAPCGDTAMYISEMSDKKPKEWTYVSDGTYKTYTVNGVDIIFKHSNNKKEITDVSEQTALFIQVLRAVGKKNINWRVIHDLAKKAKPNEKANMRFGTQKITAWIRKKILDICNVFYRYASRGAPNDKVVYPEKRTISTYFGLKVRSKSEALIATSLHLAGLEFKYERSLGDIDGQLFQPDFTIKHNGGLYFWEHAGMMYKKSYAKNWSIKEKWYNANYSGQLIKTNDGDDIGEQINDVLLNVFGITLGA